MKKILIAISLLLVLNANTFSQSGDFSERLKKDIVTVVNNNYTSVNYSFLTFADGNTAQIKLSATCPVSVISRDNFIDITSSFSIILLVATFAEIGMPDIKELDELIGDPDLTYNFVMAKNGMQVQIVTNEGRENITLTWDQVFQ